MWQLTLTYSDNPLRLSSVVAKNWFLKLTTDLCWASHLEEDVAGGGTHITQSALVRFVHRQVAGVW